MTRYFCRSLLGRRAVARQSEQRIDFACRHRLSEVKPLILQGASAKRLRRIACPLLIALVPGMCRAEAGQGPDIFAFLHWYAALGKYVIGWTALSYVVYLLLRKMPKSKREGYTFLFWIAPAICCLIAGLAMDIYGAHGG